MGQYQFKQCEIEGLVIIEPTVFGDERGYFMETYTKKEFALAGITEEFVQDNQSKSTYGVLRGLHYQKKHPQAKLVRVISGEVFDVALDLRPGSKTYGQWHGELLSAENKKQFYIPKGFAHGFVVLSKTAEFAYKCSDYYHPEDEGGILWNDETVQVQWPIPKDMKLTISKKDQMLQKFEQIREMR